MAELHDEEFMELSLDDIKNSCGFGLDIGGSVAKIAYRSNKDFKNGEPMGKPHKEGYGYIKLKRFPRDKLDDVLDFVFENCDMTKEDDGLMHVHTTGIGGNQFLKTIEQKFNANVKNEAEFDLFVKTFCKIAASSKKEDIIITESKEGLVKAKTYMDHINMFKEKMKLHSEAKLPFDKDTEDGKDAEEAKETKETKTDGDEKTDRMLPCLLVMCGSGIGILKVAEDGTFGLVDGYLGGGRTFLGLANFLLGVKNFDELMDMVSKGDGGTTDIFTRHLRSKDSFDMYSALHDDWLIYPFGQGTTKSAEECKGEDIAFSLLVFLMMELVHVVFLNAKITGIHNAYYCGNFVNHDIVRREITAYSVLRNEFDVNQKKPCEYGFVKSGGYLGAVGAFLAGNKSNK